MDWNRPRWTVTSWSGNAGKVEAPGVATLPFDRSHASFEPVVGEPVVVSLQSGERGSLVLVSVAPYFARSIAPERGNAPSDAPADAVATLARVPLPFHGDLQISGSTGHLRGFEPSPNAYALGGTDIAIEGELRLSDVKLVNPQDAQLGWSAAVDLRMCTAAERHHFAVGERDIAIAYVPAYRVNRAIHYLVCGTLRWIAPNLELLATLDDALLRVTRGGDETAVDTLAISANGGIVAMREDQRVAELLAKDDLGEDDISNVSTWATAVARIHGYAVTRA